MRTDLFDYELPSDLIAQTPPPRGKSRLLVVDRESESFDHFTFSDLPRLLRDDDTLVINDTRVIARRLSASKGDGRSIELLLLQRHDDSAWEALVRPGRALKPGVSITINAPDGDEDVTATIESVTPAGGKIVRLANSEACRRISSWGTAPLPPYIHQPLAAAEEERYQTVYSANDGSAAAPTAGLHFTHQILKSIADRGIGIVPVTLHVGVGTFRPVRTNEIEQHEMHAEVATLSDHAARRINCAPGRVVAVGTTCVRVLEAAGLRAAESSARGRVVPFQGETSIFITPGYRFHVVDALITNFHLPRSTLLMLVSAFAGRELTLSAYAEAVRERYRFFSFGDAMFIS